VTFAGANPPNVGAYLFNYCKELSEIRVPMGSEEVYRERLREQELYIVNTDPSEKLLDRCAVIGYAPFADVPKTGDSSSPALWLCLLALAGAAMTAMRKREA